MDEKEVQKKLEEIKSKRDEYKARAQQCSLLRIEEKNDPPIRDNAESLSEDEIAAQMKKWREKPDPICEACGACVPDKQEK